MEKMDRSLARLFTSLNSDTNMKKLGYPQSLVFRTYLDCKKRTRKEITFLKEAEYLTDDEKLIRFMLENSSVLERNGERSFSDVSQAVHIACKQLCPGTWCSRSHCEFYSSSSAYNCSKTRPAVCKVYKKYIEDRKIRVEKSKLKNKEQ